MKKQLLLMSCICCVMLNAQTPAQLAATQAVKETQEVQAQELQFPEDALSKSMTASLSKQGKALGVINEDGSIYVIAAAATGRPSNLPGFINSRNIAFSIAEMTAKANLLRMAGEQISSGRGFTMVEDIIEGEDPDAQQKASMLQKAHQIVDKSLDKALLYLGVSEGEIEKMNTSKKKAVYEQRYNQTIRSLVAGMVKGCAVVRVAEGESGNNDYQVAVCIKYSPEFQSLAALIKNGGKGSIPMGAGKSSQERIMNMTEADLVMHLGTLVTYNSQGQMVIYAFGQQEVRETGQQQSAAFSRAYSQARLQAVNLIKNFVAEDLVANEAQQNIEKIDEYADGTNAYFSRSKWEQAVKSKESTLNIATQPVRQWHGVHPTSKTNVAGCIVSWTPQHAQQANELKQRINSSSQPASNQSVKQATPQPTTRGAITITGSDDDL